MTETTQEEKRDFVRMSIDTIVSFKITGAGNEQHQGITRNLSASGLQMTTDATLDIGDEIELVMNHGNAKLPPFLATGKVVRREASDNGDILHVSLSLIETN